MKLEIMDKVKLDDNISYLVVNTAVFDNKEYILLVDENDEERIMVGYLRGNEFISILDMDECIRILGLFDTTKILENFDLDNNMF